MLELDCHIVHAIISLIFILVVKERSVIMPFSLPISQNAHTFMKFYILWDVNNIKFCIVGRSHSFLFSLVACICDFLVFLKPDSILCKFLLFIGIDGWYPEVKPLIVSVSVDIVLQEQVIFLTILFFINAMQVSTLIITLELKRAVFVALGVHLTIFWVRLRSTSVHLLKWFEHVGLDSRFNIFYIDCQVVFSIQSLIVPVVNAGKPTIYGKLGDFAQWLTIAC